MQRPRRTHVTRFAALVGVLVLLALDAAPLAAALRRHTPADGCVVLMPCCAAGLCPRGGHHRGASERGAGGTRWSPCGTDADGIAGTAPVHVPAILASVSRLEPPCDGGGIAATAPPLAVGLARPPLLPPPR